jgi:hypothetical protein
LSNTNLDASLMDISLRCAVPRNAPTAVDRARGVTNTQFVFRFDFESWKVCLFPELPSDSVNPMFPVVTTN